MKQSSRLKFTYLLGDGCGEYPEDLSITVECDGDCSFSQALTAFKMFLRGVEYSDDLIESLDYEDTN